MTTLTCPACHGPLYPNLARRTDDGWRHASCPRRKRVDTKICRRCGIRARFTLCGDCRAVTRELGELERWVV